MVSYDRILQKVLQLIRVFFIIAEIAFFSSLIQNECAASFDDYFNGYKSSREYFSKY